MVGESVYRFENLRLVAPARWGAATEKERREERRVVKRQSRHGVSYRQTAQRKRDHRHGHGAETRNDVPRNRARTNARLQDRISVFPVGSVGEIYAASDRSACDIYERRRARLHRFIEIYERTRGADR